MKNLLLLLTTFLVYFPQTHYVLAQVRENPEVLLAPALEVFAGSATSEEVYLITIILVAVGLFIAIIAVNMTLILHKFTWVLLGKIFTLWLLFASAVSMVALSKYLINPSNPIIKAEASATPKNVTVRVSEDNVTLLWQTDKPTLGQLKYRTDPQGFYQIVNSNQGMRTSDHTIALPRDNSFKEYWFVIISDNYQYGNQGQPLYLKL